MRRSSPTRPTSVSGPAATGWRCMYSRYSGEPPTHEREPVDVAVELVDVAAVGAAQPHGVAHDGLEHRLEPEVRAPDHLEHLARRRLLLDRLGEVPRAERRGPVACDRRFRLSRHGMVPSWLAADLRRRDRTGRSQRPPGENPSPPQPVAAPRPADARACGDRRAPESSRKARGCVHFCDRIRRNPPRRANFRLIIMRASVGRTTDSVASVAAQALERFVDLFAR